MNDEIGALKYKCPHCGAGIDDLVFAEPMVLHQYINQQTGELITHDSVASDVEEPEFYCWHCENYVDAAPFGNANGLVEQMLDRCAEVKKRIRRDKAVARKAAREKLELDGKRQAYLKDTGFLPGPQH